MKHFTIQELARLLDGKWMGEANSLVGEISTDSRTILKGQCFVALKGENQDGHDFVEHAIKQGASALIVERIPNLPVGIILPPTIQVNSTYHALAELAKIHRSHFSPKFIGITGSLGKTSTKEMIAHVLSTQYKVLKSEKSFNNNLGVPMTLLKLGTQHQVAVLEMGANAPGEIAFLSQIVRPDIGVITCIAPTHLQGFKDMDGIQKVKSELLLGMSPHSLLFVNGDDPRCLEIAKKFQGKTRTFGLARNDFQATILKSNSQRISFAVQGRMFDAPVPGKHNVTNLLAAIAVGREMGISWENLQSSIKTVSLPGLRMEVKKLSKIILIKDCYNSSPKAVIAAMESLQEFPAQRRIAILGGMLELGEKERDWHWETGREIAGKSDLLWCFGKETKAMIEGAISRGMPEKQTRYFETMEELEKAIQENLRKGDVVLVKASRKFRFELLCEKIERLFPPT